MTGLDLNPVVVRNSIAVTAFSLARAAKATTTTITALADSAEDVPKLIAEIERLSAELLEEKTIHAATHAEFQRDMREAGLDLRDARAALADALQVIADLRGAT